MEDFVSFEIAKKLKEKSFPQKTAGRYTMIDCFYYEDGRLFFHGGACDVNEAYTAPTIYQVLKWLRENKKIYIMIDRSFSVRNGWHYVICIDDDFENIIQQCVKSGRTYEKAASDAIEYICNNNLI